MYPTIYHAFYDMFGWNISALRLLNSFGFFVALAFVAASVTLAMELKRKAELGLLKPTIIQIKRGEGPNWGDIITNGVIGFIMGWKFLYLIINSGSLFADGQTPQQHIFSGEGYVFLGLLIGGGFAFWRWYDYKKGQLPQPIVEDFAMYPHHLNGNITFMAAIFGILGAKLFHLIENPDEFREFLASPSFQDFVGGLTVYGGLIVGAAGVLIYAWFKKINLWHLMDSAAPGLILAYGIGRIGCQVSGDGDWGIANTAPKPGWLSWLPDGLWAYDYPHNVNSVGVPMFPCDPAWEPHCFHLVPKVYPTPIYETIMAVLIFFLLWRLRKRIVIPGVIMSLYLIFNGIERYMIEQIRVNNKFQMLGGTWTQAEIIAVLFIITGVMMWLYVRKKFGGVAKSLKTNIEADSQAGG